MDAKGDCSTLRVQRYRQRKREYTRLDVHITPRASWRLKRLAAAWGVSRARVVDRLILEADEKYQSVLFPDLEDDVSGNTADQADQAVKK
jgi:hypothetical protein